MASADISTVHNKTVTIRGKRWRFQILDGHQYHRAEGETDYTEYKLLRHNDKGIITLASTVTAEEQYKLAGEELMRILVEPHFMKRARKPRHKRKAVRK